MEEYVSYYSYMANTEIRVEETRKNTKLLKVEDETEECDNCGNRYLLDENDRIVKIWELHLIPFIKVTPIIRRIYGSKWICPNCSYENLAYNFMRFGGRGRYNCFC